MSHHPLRLEDLFLTRRELLCRSGMGLGMRARHLGWRVRPKRRWQSCRN